MSDLLDRLDELDPELVDTDAGWTTVRRRVQRGRTARRGLTGLAAVALVATGVLAAGQLDDQESTQVTTEPEPAPAAIHLEEGWTVLPEMPIAPRVNPAIAELDDGDLFVWGGYTPGSVGLQLFDGAVLDAETGEWTELSLAPDVIPNEAVALWTGEQVVVMPSIGTIPVVALVWDASDDSWTESTPGPEGCGNQGATWTGQEVVVSCNNGVFHAYDPVADAWRQLPDPPVSYASADLAWTGDRLVAFGRTESFDVPAGDGMATTYDPDTDSWGDAFRVPLNAQASAITWTGEEIVGVNYDMAAAAFDPATGEARELPPLPLRFYECSPVLATAGSVPVAVLCSGSAVLAPDERWTPLDTSSLLAVGTVSGSDAVYGTDEEGHIVAYRPPEAGDDGRIPIGDRIQLGLNPFAVPDDAEIVDVSLVAEDTVEARVVLEDGTGCTARSGYGPMDADGLADGDERVAIAGDGWTADAAVGRATPGAVTVAWYWSPDRATDRNEATCPTLEQAVALAAGFDTPL